MYYNDFELEKEFDKILYSPQELIFNNITKGIYEFDRSILHATAIENNHDILQKAMDILPKTDRTDALESTDDLGNSTISYSARDTDSLKIALSQYKDSTPLHILCYVNGEQEEHNLGVAIALLEHDKINSNLQVGLNYFNPAIGINKKDSFNKILPKSTIKAYEVTKKQLH